MLNVCSDKAGEAAVRRNLKKSSPGTERGTVMLAVIEGLPVRFLTPGEQGNRGAPAGALGSTRECLKGWRHVVTVGEAPVVLAASWGRRKKGAGEGGGGEGGGGWRGG
jgi:hypothetical protein